MTYNNLAFKTQEERLPQDITTDKPYIGGSELRKIIGKTEDGKVIDDLLKQRNAADTAHSVSEEELYAAAHIKPYRNFAWISPAVDRHSIILKKWHGYVDSVDGDEFTAILTDQSGESPDVQVSFSLREVSEGDRDLVCKGALIDWVICRERKLHGNIENKDFLDVRRFPAWKKSELETKSAKVEAFNEWLNSDTSE